MQQYGDSAYAPAQEVYTNGVDDCDGLAEFAACVMTLNRIEAYNVGISILGPSGHNVAGFVGADGRLYGISNGETIAGPFDTWEALAQFYIDAGFAPANGVIWLLKPCLDKVYLGNAILTIPRLEIR
jgi:hypothetical protein